ncbi:hypothetical protein T12_2010, partial [Trichinella patagoniensis]
LRLFVNNRGNVYKQSRAARQRLERAGRPGSDWKRCLQIASVC